MYIRWHFSLKTDRFIIADTKEDPKVTCLSTFVRFASVAFLLIECRYVFLLLVPKNRKKIQNI